MECMSDSLLAIATEAEFTARAAPAPKAKETSPPAKAGASLMPSPIIPTLPFPAYQGERETERDTERQRDREERSVS